MIIQFCGLSGSGKTTLARKIKDYFIPEKISIEIIDGDDYRQNLCSDLGYSREDRNTNIRRLAFIAGKLAQYNIIPIICAINPYDDIRKEITITYPDVKTVYINCSLSELIKRDTKGLYAKAILPEGHPDKINNLSGINDPFEIPARPDLIIETDHETISTSSLKLKEFIEMNLYTKK